MKKSPTKFPRKWRIFSVTATGTFMSTLDAGIVNIALPVMSSQFGANLENIQWVVTIYLLTLTCFLPVFGKLSDMYSRKKLYLGGFLTFGIGSVLCSLATNLPMMIVARTLQGLGGSAMVANSQAIIAKAFPGKDRGRALGSVGAVVALGSLSGPAVGGFLIQHFGWPSVFWINIPVCLIGVWRGLRIIPRFEAKNKLKMDIAGAVFFIISCFTFLYALDTGTNKSWLSPQIVITFAVAILFGLLFYQRERVSKTPFIGLSIFKNRTISFGLVVAIFGFCALFCNSILLPFYLTDVMHLDPVKIGLLILPFPIALAISSPISGLLSERYSARIITTAGLGLIMVGALMFAYIGPSPSVFYIILAQVVMGTGSGVFQVPNNNTVISAAPKNKLGIVTSTNALCRNIGTVLGVALSVAVFVPVKEHALAAAINSQDAFLRGYAAAMYFAAFLALAGGLISSQRE